MALALWVSTFGGSAALSARPGAEEGDAAVEIETLAATPWDSEVAFELDNYQVIVEVRINGKGPFRMNVDTGVYPSVVDETAAARAGLVLTGPRGFVAGAGCESITYRRSTVDSLTLGDHLLRDLPVIVAKTRHLPIDGTLGESFFRRRAVQLDYPQRRLRLGSAGSLAPSQSAPVTLSVAEETGYGLPLAVDFSGRVPRLLDVAIAGKAVEAWLDTGSSAGLVLSSATLRKLGLEQLAQGARPVVGIGSRGDFVGSLVEVPTLRLGPVRRSNIPTLLAPMTGIWVGNAFLHELVLTLDYEARRAFINDPGIPRKPKPPPRE